MEKLLFVIIAQLLSGILARLDGSELERHHIKIHGRRRERLVTVDSFAKEQKAEETKMMNWMTEERYDKSSRLHKVLELFCSVSLTLFFCFAQS